MLLRNCSLVSASKSTKDWSSWRRSRVDSFHNRMLPVQLSRRFSSSRMYFCSILSMRPWYALSLMSRAIQFRKNWDRCSFMSDSRISSFVPMLASNFDWFSMPSLQTVICFDIFLCAFKSCTQIVLTLLISSRSILSLLILSGVVTGDERATGGDGLERLLFDGVFTSTRTSFSGSGDCLEAGDGVLLLLALERRTEDRGGEGITETFGVVVLWVGKPECRGEREYQREPPLPFC
mmetsp:Transcript_28120/g.60284  ORF Transcript_28120/g.60284 Transcript_28120/m.60284 type:complete len:235 (-) Transcript_28120:169-873(-)